MNTFAKNLPIRSNSMSGMERISDMPRCRIIRLAAGAGSIPNATFTAIPFDNITAMPLDTDGFWNPATPTRATIHTSGLYDAKAAVRFAVSGGGALRAAWIGLNGTLARFGQDFRNPTANQVTLNAAASMTLNAGDYLEVLCYQDSGGGLALDSVGATTNYAELNLCLIST